MKNWKLSLKNQEQDNTAHSYLSYPTRYWGKKEIKGIQIGKEKIKLSLFADDTILYTEKSNDFPPKKIRNNKYIKVAGYKVNIKKSIGFLYTNNKLAEK